MTNRLRFGPGTYQSVGKQILEAGLAVPTGDAITPLVHAAYCRASGNEEFSDVRRAMRNYRFWVYNQDFWTSEGLYVVQDTQAQGLSKIHSLEALENRLKGGKELSWGGIRFSKDGSVRFAPKGSYTLGRHTPQSFAKDGAVVAQYGVRGAELLGEVIEILQKPAIIYGLEIQKDQEPEQRVSTLVEDDGALHLGGYYFDYCGADVGFGVFGTGEACTPKNHGSTKGTSERAPVKVKSRSGFQQGRKYDIEVGDDGKYVHEDTVIQAVNIVKSGGKYPSELVADFEKTLERNLRKGDGNER